MAEHEHDDPSERRDAPACAAEWLRDLARAVKVARLYRAQNPVALDTRGRLADALASHLARFGEWSFRVTASEMFLGEDLVVKPLKRAVGHEAVAPGLLEQLPFLFYRDGVRRITFLPGIPSHDIDALVDALIDAWSDRGNIDDLVTTLWQVNPTHIQLETVPFEQMLYVSTGPGAEGEVERGHGLGHGLAPRAEEIRAELGATGGSIGLQKETGLEEEIPEWFADPAQAYADLTLASSATARVARRGMLEAWEKERHAERLELGGRLFTRLLAIADEPSTRAALARYVVTGVAGSIAHTSWDEACRTLELVRRLDVDGSVTAQTLIDAVAAQSESDLGESLDEATPLEQARFFAFAVGLGHAGVALALAALAGATRSRTRAAACTALAYLCSDDPFALEAAVGDTRANVVLGVVSVLGQIGGSGVSPLLALAAQHPDPRVLREVARALAGVPAPERAGLITGMLASPDAALCGEALKIARLEPDRTIARVLLKSIEDPAFERRPEEIRHAFFQALTDSGGDLMVPALEQMATHGGWFARASWQRSAAAHALGRMGSDAARKALDRGMKHASEAVRSVCRDAIERRAA